jgi:outer membrane lipase/esterase
MRLTAMVMATAIAATTLSFAAGAAAARPFDHLWVFGDSTVDTGWYNFTLSGESQFDQYLSIYNSTRPPNNPPTYGMGKATSNPGPISVEVLAALIGTDVLPADQPRLLLPAPIAGAAPEARELIVPLPRPHLTGTNYANGGARNHDVNPPLNPLGINLFPNAVPTETQIGNYLSQFSPTGRSLYVISSGGNDVSFALNSPPDDPMAYLKGAADSLAAAIATLQQRGALYIIVTNLPESFGVLDLERTYRHNYNTELMSQLTALGVSYVWADMNGLRLQIVADPPRFGIFYTSNQFGERACTTPPPALGVSKGWAYLCSPLSPVSMPISESFADAALFADNEHWATGGHRVLGSYYYCLAVSTWPQLFPRPFIPPIGPPTACNAFLPIQANAP